MPHTIRTERLLLREVSLRDAPDFWKHMNCPEYTSTTGTWRYPFDRKEVRRRILTTAPEDFWFTATVQGGFSGSGLLFGRTDDSVEVGYAIAQPFAGQGLATEMAAALVRFSFRALKCRSVRATVSVDNPASQRILQRLGFEREGGVTTAWSAHYSEYTPCYDYRLMREGAPL